MAAARPVQDKKEKLLRLIECPICLNELQDPRLLSCRHTLCYTCLKDYTEKGNYGNQLPCPVCRGVTVLYQGGVDNLPKFFFMNELKEVVAEKDNEDDSKPQSQGGAVCSAEDCGQQAVKYCKDGCQFLCQQCFDTHRSFKITTNHQVIPADEGEAFTEPNNPPFPPCNRHKHQVMDLFCRTCDVPICSTCYQLNHRSHDFCELEEQAAVCKFKLSEIYEHTDGLILIVKQAMHKTKHQTKQAEADIDDTCKKVKSVFKIMHGKLNEEEKKMLLELQEARSHVKKMSDVTVDSQMMTLARLESLKSCESKLADKGSPYNFVTVTESIQRDVEDYYDQQLPGFVWSCHFVRKNGAGDGFPSGKVKIRKISEATENRGEMKEVDRIQLHNHKQHVQGLAVHNEHIYTVHYTNFIVYCFAGNGTLCSKYKHDMENKTVIQGMCLIVNGDTAMLVVSDFTNGALVWIRIDEDFTMNHYDTQQLDYRPYGSYNDNGSLLVCAEDNTFWIHPVCTWTLNTTDSMYLVQTSRINIMCLSTITVNSNVKRNLSRW